METEKFSILLKSVFGKLFIWRETTSSKAWILEKMRDVFSKELELNPDQIDMKSFIEFLQSFYDSQDGDNLVQYPQFVMNVTSEMVTQVILSGIEVRQEDQNLMFKLLRSALTQGQFDKGQRISTMFDCLKKLFVCGKTVELMMPCQFDATFALLFGVGSTQNYTRKSAKEYLIELVKLAFNESDADKNLLKQAKLSAKNILLNLFRTFNESLIQNIRRTNLNCLPDIVMNYCQILSSCAECSVEWGKALGFSSTTDEQTFHVWCDLLKYLNSTKFYDVGDVVVSSVKQLVGLAIQRVSSNEQVLEYEMISSLVSEDMVDANSAVKIRDVMVMAHSIIARCENSHLSTPTRKRLLTLSILPLLVILGVPISDSGDQLYHAIQATKEELEKEVRTKCSSNFISCALRNAFSLVENKGLDTFPVFASTIRYATFKTMDLPETATRPLMDRGVVSGRTSFECLIAGFKEFQVIIDNPAQELKVYEAEAIQTYVVPVASFHGISHFDLIAALECYLAVLRRLNACGTACNKDCLLSVLNTLELHLVNMDSNLRETAVKYIGQLYQIELRTLQNEASMVSAKFLPSVWTCVKDKEENVVTQVFDFILTVVQSGDSNCLRVILDDMGIAQETLITELQTNILSSQWDNIKPVSFSLFSSLANKSDVIRYAEVCLQQSMSLATPAVFGLISKLLKTCTEGPGCKGVGGGNDDVGVGDGLELECRVTQLCELLWEGWGDLILMSLNGDNTTYLRYSVDILFDLHQFVASEEVVTLMKNMVEDVEKVSNGENRSVVDGLETLKQQVVKHSKSVLKGSFFLQTLDNNDEANDMCVAERNVSGAELDAVDNGQCSDVEIMEKYDECFDHTIEMQPFVLSTRAFPFPSIVSRVLDQLSLSGSQSGLSHLFIFCGFKQFLGLLPLSLMKEEVCRSTDEYDRNSVTILKDISNSLDSSFQILCRKLEKEVLDVFSTEVFEIIHCLMTVMKEDSESVNLAKESLVKLGYWIHTFMLSKESFAKYVLSQRRSVTVGEIDNSKLECISDFINKGLAAFRCDLSKDISLKSYFSSTDGLKELFNKYCDSLFDRDKVTDNIGDVKLILSEENLQTAVEEIRNSKESSPSFSTPTNRTTTVLSLEILQSIVETCKYCVMKPEIDGQGDASVVGVGALFKALGQIKEMEDEYEDDFDDGNDPTAIDCY